MQVSRRSLEVAMSEQQLNAAQVRAPIEQVCGEGVAQNMWAERLANAQLLAQLLAGDTNSVRLERLPRSFPLKEPVLGLAPAPVDAQDLQQLRRQHHLARKLALAFADVNDHPLAV